jgi:hypothetical protein
MTNEQARARTDSHPKAYHVVSILSEKNLLSVLSRLSQTTQN